MSAELILVSLFNTKDSIWNIFWVFTFTNLLFLLIDIIQAKILFAIKCNVKFTALKA